MQKDIDSQLTQARLQELFSYNPETGTFCHMHNGCNAGYKNADGYVLLAVDGRTYRAHRLAWLYVYGLWPAKLLDHENRNRADNRISNLRESTRSENTQNTITVRAQSGVRGVSPNGKRWRAAIAVDGKDHYLGSFDTIAEAAAVRAEAERQLHPRSPLSLQK